MDRETTTLVVGANTLTVLTYLTGRELRDIQNAMLDNLDMKQKNGETEIGGFKASMLSAQQDKQIEIIVKKFNEETSDIVNKVLDLPSDEFQIVTDYLKKITEKKGQASK